MQLRFNFVKNCLLLFFGQINSVLPNIIFIFIDQAVSFTQMKLKLNKICLNSRCDFDSFKLLFYFFDFAHFFNKIRAAAGYFPTASCYPVKRIIFLENKPLKRRKATDSSYAFVRARQ